MGEARRKQMAGENVGSWLASLPPAQRVVADTALKLHRNFVEPSRFSGGCYLLAFFLQQYLEREHGIATQAVVGFTCDGTTPLQASHAWLEYEGLKTDISLTETDDPEVQPPGQLLVLDRVIRRGVATYSYQREESAQSRAHLTGMLAEAPEYARISEHKEREHLAMAAFAQDKQAMWEYLQQAPAPVRYDALAGAIRRA